jgi:hypothetical protein
MFLFQIWALGPNCKQYKATRSLGPFILFVKVTNAVRWGLTAPTLFYKSILPFLFLFFGGGGGGEK